MRNQYLVDEFFEVLSTARCLFLKLTVHLHRNACSDLRHIFTSVFRSLTIYSGVFHSIHYIHGIRDILYVHLFQHKQHFPHVRDVLYTRIITFLSSPHLSPCPLSSRKGDLFNLKGWALQHNLLDV